MASDGSRFSTPKTMASDGSRINTPSSQKLKLTVEETLNDRISELPESLLLQILSSLPTKDAFTTCILSKKWQYIWTSLDNFTFTSENHIKNLAPFIDYILAHSLSPKIRKFQLEYQFYDAKCQSQISKWLNFVVKKEVEDVLLWSFPLTETHPLPESFYTCSSLITLALARYKFDDVVIMWKSLKSVKLGFFIVDNDLFVKLLSSCPVLESMELYDLVLNEGLHRLEIGSSKLKRLKLNGHWRLGNQIFHPSLEIVAPYLQHLEISGELWDLECMLVDVSAVVTAKLSFNITCIKDIMDDHGREYDPAEDSCRDYHHVFRTLVQDYLQKLQYAIELTIGTWFTEVLCMLMFKGISLPEMKCKYMTLELQMKKFNLYGLLGLLQVSPHVETLNIDISTEALNIDISTQPLEDSLCHFELAYLAEGDDIDLQSWISNFGFPNLKNVNIVNSSGVCFKDHFKQDFDKLLKLSAFLLKNAKVLEKFMISKRIKCEICSINRESTCLSQLAEKLLGCPRSSKNCVIVY